MIKEYFRLRKCGMVPSNAWICSMDRSAFGAWYKIRYGEDL